MRRLGPACALLVSFGGPGAQAAVRTVGAAAAYPTLAAAVSAAQDGDTIHLGPGSYYECAILSQRNLVLEGEGVQTIITDATCEGKAVIVVRSGGITIRDLVLARARVPDHNGAGVRLEGGDLTLDRVRFENDEVGLLAGEAGGRVVVRDSTFTGGGVPGDRPSFAVLVGGGDLLRIERSVFEGFKGGQVSSAARLTELSGNTLSGGVEPDGGSIVTSSGRLSMDNNTIELGPNPISRQAAVVVTGPATLRGNRLVNRTGAPAALLLDWSGDSPVMSDNVVAAGDTAVSQEGIMRHRAGTLARQVKGDLHDAASGAKRLVRGLLGR